MSSKDHRNHPKIAVELHPLNPHQGRYDLTTLCQTVPELKDCLVKRVDGELTLDFSQPDTVTLLNKALLKEYYGVEYWSLPPGYLCPPVPGRVDYICHIADLLLKDAGGEIPKGKAVRGLDIGTGANLIYPIVGSQLFGWQFVGSEIDDVAYHAANAIASLNSNLKSHVRIRQQPKKENIFKNVVKDGEYFDFTMCNPPFHSSAEAASQGTQKKWKNLKRNQSSKGFKPKNYTNSSRDALNFGGQGNELWCDGGEVQFIQTMIKESALIQTQVGWFTSLVSKKESLPPIKKALVSAKAADVQVVEMAQGNKMSRFVAWRF